jgi:NAD(P)-dependent dehydrogenase (short-subunit alcohol dehydrogenase family)
VSKGNNNKGIHETLKGQVAIVTGGGQGMGRGIALALGEGGTAVTIADKNLETAESVANEIKSRGSEALAVRVDVTVPSDVAQLMDAVVAKFGRIDILVNNAGVVPPITPTTDLAYDLWNLVISINLGGYILCSQAAARYMIKHNYGVIINIASVVAHACGAGVAVYCATKAGVLGLTRGLAVEWAPYNIRVNAISPGIARTANAEARRQANPKAFDTRLKRIPLGRMAETSDIGNMARFLASPESSYITGHEFTVDGGMFAVHPGWVSP